MILRRVGGADTSCWVFFASTQTSTPHHGVNLAPGAKVASAELSSRGKRRCLKVFLPEGGDYNALYLAYEHESEKCGWLDAIVGCGVGEVGDEEEVLPPRNSKCDVVWVSRDPESWPVRLGLVNPWTARWCCFSARDSVFSVFDKELRGEVCDQIELCELDSARLVRDSSHAPPMRPRDAVLLEIYRSQQHSDARASFFFAVDSTKDAREWLSVLNYNNDSGRRALCKTCGTDIPALFVDRHSQCCVHTVADVCAGDDEGNEGDNGRHGLANNGQEEEWGGGGGVVDLGFSDTTTDDDVVGVVKQLRRTLAQQPDNFNALYRLGAAFHRLARFAEAADCFRRALRVSPDHPASTFNLGVSLMDAADSRGDNCPAVATTRSSARDLLEEAVSVLRESTSLASTDGARHDTWFNIAVARRRLGSLGGCDDGGGGGASSLRARSLNEAIDAYQRALQFKPYEPRTMINLAVALMHNNDVHGAIKSYESLLEKRPHHAPASFNLGIALSMIGDSDGAIAAYEASLDCATKEHHGGEGRSPLGDDALKADCLTNLGHELEKAGRMHATVARYRQALDLRPQHAPTAYNLGLALEASANSRQQFAEAGLVLAAALPGLRAMFGKTHNHCVGCYSALERCRNNNHVDDENKNASTTVIFVPRRSSQLCGAGVQQRAISTSEEEG